MNATITTYTNNNTGMTSIISQVSRGYAVALRDDDAGETLPYVTIFPTIERANAYAREIAGV